MEDFCRYLGVNRILSLICCMLWIFSPAGGNTISEVVDSRVILHCNNKSNYTLHQLTWKMNGDFLISFKPPKDIHVSEKAASLKMNISLSENQLYTLVIERAEKSHTGNYTCDTTTSEGVREQKWELIITGHKEAENWNTVVIPVAVIVPCVCCIVFIIALTILRRLYNRHAENRNRSPTAEMDQSEDIYENCLEANVREQQNYHQPHHHRPRAHRY